MKKFGRTRNAVGIRTERRVFPQLLRVLPNFQEYFFNTIETRGTCFLYLQEKPSRKQVVYFYHQNVNYLCSRDHRASSVWFLNNQHAYFLIVLNSHSGWICTVTRRNPLMSQITIHRGIGCSFQHFRACEQCGYFCDQICLVSSEHLTKHRWKTANNL